MKMNLILCYVLAAIALVFATDYCAMNCTVNGLQIRHIACGQDQKFSPNCPKSVEIINITEPLKNIFLDEYNAIRNFVAGGANSTYNYSPGCRMATIQWENELAEHAALRSKKCTIRSDWCHTTSTFRNSGQDALEYHNYLPVEVKDIVASAINSWFKFIRYNKYSDMLADRNTRVGCAIAYAPSDDKAKYKSTPQELDIYWITCNYATDIQSRESMYETCDLPAKSCTTGTNPHYPHLCSVNESYE